MDELDRLSKYELIFEEKYNEKILKIVTSWNNFKPLLIKVNDLARSIKQNTKVPVYEGKLPSTETVRSVQCQQSQSEIEIYNHAPEEYDENKEFERPKIYKLNQVNNKIGDSILVDNEFKEVESNYSSAKPHLHYKNNNLYKHQNLNNSSKTHNCFSHEKGTHPLRKSYSTDNKSKYSFLTNGQKLFFKNRALKNNETQTDNICTLLIEVTNSELECYEGSDYIIYQNNEDSFDTNGSKFVYMTNMTYDRKKSRYHQNYVNNETQTLITGKNVKYVIMESDSLLDNSYHKSCNTEDSIFLNDNQYYDFLYLETNKRKNFIHRYTSTEKILIEKKDCKVCTCDSNSCNVSTCCGSKHQVFSSNLKKKNKYLSCYFASTEDTSHKQVRDDLFYSDCGSVLKSKTVKESNKEPKEPKLSKQVVIESTKPEKIKKERRKIDTNDNDKKTEELSKSKWDTSKLFRKIETKNKEFIVRGDFEVPSAIENVDDEDDQNYCECSGPQCGGKRCVFADYSMRRPNKPKKIVLQTGESDGIKKSNVSQIVFEEKQETAEPVKKDFGPKDKKRKMLLVSSPKDDNYIPLKWDTRKLFIVPKKVDKDAAAFDQDMFEFQFSDEDIFCNCDTEKCAPTRCAFAEKLAQKTQQRVKLQGDSRTLTFDVRKKEEPDDEALDLKTVLSSHDSIIKRKRKHDKISPQAGEKDEYLIDITGSKWNTEKLFRQKARKEEAIDNLELTYQTWSGTDDDDKLEYNCQCDSPYCKSNRCAFAEDYNKEKGTKSKVPRDIKFELDVENHPNEIKIIDDLSTSKKDVQTTTKTKMRKDGPKSKQDKSNESDVSSCRWNTTRLFAQKEKASQAVAQLSDGREFASSRSRIQFENVPSEREKYRGKLFKCSGKDCTAESCPFAECND